MSQQFQQSQQNNKKSIFTIKKRARAVKTATFDAKQEIQNGKINEDEPVPILNSRKGRQIKDSSQIHNELEVLPSEASFQVKSEEMVGTNGNKDNIEEQVYTQPVQKKIKLIEKETPINPSKKNSNASRNSKVTANTQIEIVKQNQEEYKNRLNKYIFEDFSQRSECFLRKVACDNKWSHISRQFPLLKILKSITKKFQLNELELTFLAYFLDQLGFQYQTIETCDYEHVPDFLNYTDYQDRPTYKQLLLYLILAAYAVKQYLNTPEDMTLYDAHLQSLFNEHYEPFQKFSSSWIKKHGFHLSIKPTILNDTFKQYSQKASDYSEDISTQDYNSMVDSIIQICPPYNNEKSTASTGGHSQAFNIKNENEEEPAKHISNQRLEINQQNSSNLNIQQPSLQLQQQNINYQDQNYNYQAFAQQQNQYNQMFYNQFYQQQQQQLNAQQNLEYNKLKKNKSTDSNASDVGLPQLGFNRHQSISLYSAALPQAKLTREASAIFKGDQQYFGNPFQVPVPLMGQHGNVNWALPSMIELQNMQSSMPYDAQLYQQKSYSKATENIVLKKPSTEIESTNSPTNQHIQQKIKTNVFGAGFQGKMQIAPSNNINLEANSIKTNTNVKEAEQQLQSDELPPKIDKIVNNVSVSQYLQ